MEHILMGSLTPTQKVLNSIFVNNSSSTSDKIHAYTKQVCLPALINLPELKEDMPTIAFICYFNAINLISNQTMLMHHEPKPAVLL